MEMITKQVPAWKITGPNQLAFGEHTISATPAAGFIRVTPLYVGICGSDTDLCCSGGKHSSHKGETKPIIPGHELCGRITAIGEGVEGFAAGEIVVVEPALPCGKCIDCRRGAYNCCKTTGYWATPPVDGCFVKEIDVLPRWTYKVPADMDPMLASLTEPLAACVEAIYAGSKSRTQMPIDEHILILGGGNIAMGVALVLGDLINPNKVIIAARKQSDLDFAKKLGIHNVVQLGDAEQNKAAMKKVLEITGRGNPMDGGVGSIVECTGSEQVLSAAIEARVVFGYGRIIGVGCHGKIPVDIPLLRRSAISFVPVRRSNDKFGKTMRIIQDNKERARLLIGRIGKFEELDKVLLNGAGESTGTGGPKTVIRF
jgi:threonine dehydrogenase-like Zn-dependent dehydrogenase